MTNEELTFQVHSLAGETLALQMILTQLLFHLERGADKPIHRAFDDAANMVEHMTIAAGRTVSPQHLAKALEIIESTRKAVIPSKTSAP